MSSLIIRFKLLFQDLKRDVVSDMRLDPSKMHRLLIAYEETAIILFSLNKNRELQRIHFSAYDQDRGKALALEFLNNEG